MSACWGIRVGDWMQDHKTDMVFVVKSIASRVEMGVTQFYAVDKKGEWHHYNDCRLLKRTGAIDWGRHLPQWYER